MKRKRIVGILFTLAWLLPMVLIGCGGGGDGGGGSSNGSDIPGPGGPSGDVLTGVFLDNAVAGLDYETATQSGVTDEEGTFRYQAGETVVFSIGAVVIGQTEGAPIVTPLNLVPGATDAAHPAVTRICRLLQGLDRDDDLRNGIRIPEEARGLAGAWDLDVTDNDAEFQTAAHGMFSALHRNGVFAEPRSLPPAEQARDHIRTTLAVAVHPIDATGNPSRFLSADPGQGAWTNAEDYDDVFTPPEADSDGDDVAREIEEADIVKIEGDQLFILNRYRGLILCDISNPDSPAITGRLAMTGEPKEMYIRGDRAHVLARLYGEPVYGVADAADSDIAPAPAETLSRIYVADIANPENPVLAGSFDLEGDIIDSRIVGDVLYVVYSETFWYWGVPENGILDDALNETTTKGPEVFVASFDISDPTDIHEVDRERFDGTARHIHVTEDAVFVASVAANGWDTTRITYVDISDPGGAVFSRGSTTIPGQMADEFKMDCHDGYLRAVTYEWIDGGVSRLSVIDVSDPDIPAVVGRAELGHGEQLFATRFDGDRAYLVTYERKDPLWVVDLSDPRNPEIKGELIVPGWSTHIEPLGDRLVALGVDDTDGWRVAVSLFDVADPTQPGLIERLSFGEQDGWSGTTAYNDVKAFTVDEDLGLILLPYSGSYYANGVHRTDHRLQLIDYSPSDIAARGWVSQKGDVLRGRVHGDRLYSVSSDELQVIDAGDRDDPRVTAAMALAANITDFMPLANDHGVQGVMEPGGGYRLQSVRLSDPDNLTAVGAIDIGAINAAGLFGNGNLVYVAENHYGVYPEDAMDYGNGAARLTVVDFSDPAAPRERGRIDIPGANIRPVPMMSDAAVYPHYWGADLIQVEPDVMALIRGDSWYANGYDDTESDGPRLTVLDLSDSDAPRKAADLTIDAPGAAAPFARNRILYFSYPGETETDSQDRTLVRYYLGRVDLTDPSNPVSLDPVNIPGVCVGMEGFGPYIFTIDRAWVPNGGWKTTFNSLKLEDEKALLLDVVGIPDAAPMATVADGLAWLSGAGYGWSGGGLTLIDVSDPQNPRKYAHDVKGAYPRVIGARGTKAFVNVAGGTALYDASNPETLRLDGFRNHGGWSDRIRFLDDRAYLPLGYYGVWGEDL